MASPRCHSWRRGRRAHDELHRPGECVRCWRPCHRPLTDDLVRCEPCRKELVFAPETWVRLALISELHPHADTIDLMVSDNDITVNYRAKWQRAHRPGAVVVDEEWAPMTDSGEEI